MEERIDKALQGLLPYHGGRDEWEEGANEEQQRGCRPWDRNDLLYRLRTYNAITWFCRPMPANALSCACHGWINTTKYDTLECESCKATLEYPKSSSLTDASCLEVAEKFALSLRTGHKEECAWSNAACEKSLITFPVQSHEKLCQNFNHRLKGLEQLSSLPPISQTAVTEIFRNNRSEILEYLIMACLPPNSQTKTDDLSKSAKPWLLTSQTSNYAEKGSDDFGHRARVLAICGWDVKLLPENKMGPLVRWNSLTNRAENVDRAIIKCRLCGSKAGLWKFKEASEKSLKKGAKREGEDAHTIAGRSLKRKASKISLDTSPEKNSYKKEENDTPQIPVFGDPNISNRRQIPVFGSQRKNSGASVGELTTQPSPKIAEKKQKFVSPNAHKEQKMYQKQSSKVESTPPNGNVNQDFTFSVSPESKVMTSKMSPELEFSKALSPSRQDLGILQNSIAGTPKPISRRSSFAGSIISQGTLDLSETKTSSISPSSTTSGQPFGSKKSQTPLFGSLGRRESSMIITEQSQDSNTPVLVAPDSTVRNSLDGTLKSPSTENTPSDNNGANTKKSALTSLLQDQKKGAPFGSTFKSEAQNSRHKDKKEPQENGHQTHEKDIAETQERVQDRNTPESQTLLNEEETEQNGLQEKLEDIYSEAFKSFDPIHQHKDFCPWILCLDVEKPGWEITLNALLDSFASIQKRKRIKTPHKIPIARSSTVKQMMKGESFEEIMARINSSVEGDKAL